MSEFPTTKPVTLRYIPDITNHTTDTKAPGGLYATAPDPMMSNAIMIANLVTPPEFNQQWLFVPDGRGVKVQLAPEPPMNTGGGPGPVELPHAWKNESKFSGPVALSQPDRASTYYLNIFKKSASGWIVTICPLGTHFGMESLLTLSQLEIVGVASLENAPCPGWFVEKAAGDSN